MTSQRAREGYLLVDNRHAPGPDGTTFLEAATIRCSHCHQQLIRNPARARERAWCFKCDRYLCDRCAVLAKLQGCKPLDKVLDELQTEAIRKKVACG